MGLDPMDVAKQNIDAIIKQYSNSQEWKDYLLSELERHGFVDEMFRLQKENEDLRALCAAQKKQIMILERQQKYGKFNIQP